MQRRTIGRKSSRRASSAGASIFCFFCIAAASSLADSAPEKNVLVLYSFSPRETFTQLEPLKKAARARFSGSIHFYVEYLESLRFSDAGYRKALAETTIESYRGRKIDLIVVVAYPALQFALDYRDRIGPALPIVFASVAPSRLANGIPWLGVTGVTTGTDLGKTLNLALTLQPDTRNVAVVAGPSEFEQHWAAVLSHEVDQSPRKLNFLAFSLIEKKSQLVKALQLPPHTVLFYDVVPQESSQAEIGPYEALDSLSEKIPTYCFFRYCLDHGGIGAYQADEAVSGYMAGGEVAQILSGQKPEDIPLVNNVASYTVDWRELQHWVIPESVLPAGTLVLSREPSVWEKYGRYVGIAIVLIFSQALLIAILILQRMRGRRGAANLRESEKRFRVMAETTPSLIWMSDRHGDLVYLNEKRIAFTGEDSNLMYHDAWKQYIHPDDLNSVITSNQEALSTRQSFSKEYRLRRQDGVYRWMLDIAAPRIDGDGAFAGFIGSANWSARSFVPLEELV